MKILWLVIMVCLIAGNLLGCSKKAMTEEEEERITFVKETLSEYGLEMVTEVTKDTLEENGKDTKDILSFGNNQIYEMSYSDLSIKAIFYHMFESNEDGGDEAEMLYSRLKANYKELPNSVVTENIDEKAGNRIYRFELQLTDIEETTNTVHAGDTTAIYSPRMGDVMSVVLTYDKERNEVGIIEEMITSADDEQFTEQVIEDLGWSITEDK